jgi:hypothetical protein
LKNIVVIAALAVLATTALADDTLWTRVYRSESAAMDRGKSVATIGNEIFVAGTEQAMTANILLIRYEADGDTEWVRALDIDTMEMASDVAVGSDTAPVVCAQIQAATSRLLLVKYNKSGDTLWTRRRSGMNPISVAVDGQNAVYVWGSLSGTMPDESLGLFKYASDGTPAWEKVLSWGTMNRCAGLAATSDGVVAIASCNDSTGGHRWLVKFNSSGDTVWRRALDTLGGDPQSVTCDPAGAMYVGLSRGAQTGVARCSTNGRTEWLRSVEVQPGADAQNLTALDAAGRLHVAGTTPQQRLVVVKLTAAGDIYSTNFGPESLFFMLSGVAADAAGRPVLTGTTQSVPPSCVTIMLSGTVALEEARPAPAQAVVRNGGTRVAGTPLTVCVSRAGSYRVELFDARGSRVQRLHSGFLTAGEHPLALTTTAAGSYFLRVTGEGSQTATKLVQVR